MNRSNGIAYPTNGSSALEAQATVLSVHNGYRRSQNRRRSQDIEPEVLTFGQKVKAIAVIACVIAALAATLIFSDEAAARTYDVMFDGIAKQTITVHTGDSLWTIAEDHAPEGASVPDVVRWIEQANNLDSALIVSGQALIVPAE